MGPLKKIIYDCEKATFLIEKKLGSRITFREQMELSIHLVRCKVCRIYQHQSGRINEMVRQLFRQQVTDTRLDDNFKKNLQDRIEEEINKN